MVQSLQLDDGTLVIPGAYPKETVATSNSGVSTNGILFLVGEADAGPDFTSETDIAQNIFGPNSLAAVKAKYKSGPVVDAFNGASTPSNDQQITGSFNGAIILKTNKSTKGSFPLLNWAASAYGT